MSMCTHGPEHAELLALVAAARCHDPDDRSWTRPEAEKLVGRVVKELARPLVRDFPGLHPDEVRNETWLALNHPDLAKAKCPWAWVRDRARRKLNKAARTPWANRELRALLIVEHGRNLVSPALDVSLDKAEARDVARLWSDLRELLIHLRWPRDDAALAVTTLRELVEDATGKVSATAAATKLRDAGIEARLKLPLAEFVFDVDGYMQERIKGISAYRTLKIPAVQQKLAKIVWTHPARLRSVKRHQNEESTFRLVAASA